MSTPLQRAANPLWSLATLLFQLCGMFVLPFVVALIGALFLEVSEVAETAPTLLTITVVILAPVVLAQILGLILKSRRELRWWKARGPLTLRRRLAVLASHASVVTPRGWTLLVLGCGMTLVALGMQWASFGLIAALGLLLFYLVTGWTLLVSTFMVRTFEHGLGKADATITRRMEPAVVHVGEEVQEVWTFRRIPVPAGYRLFVEDPMHPRLRTESRYVVGSGVRTGELTLRGRLRATPRGYYEVGPANLRYQDLLGLTRVSVASVATAALKVLPRVKPIDVIEPPRMPSSEPDVITKPHRYATEDLFRFREFGQGDDTRRIHWRLSLKHGRVQVRLPETREITTQDVLLVLDSYVPPSILKAAEAGAEPVLDALVDAWLSLAVELIQRGDRVTLLAAVRQHGKDVIDRVRIPCRKGEIAKWQDLGARVAWQTTHDVDALMEACPEGAHGLIATARVLGPPPGRLAGADTTWIVVDPMDALGAAEPHWMRQVIGSNPLGLASWILRLPHPTGSEDNAFFRRWAQVYMLWRAWSARKVLRRRIAAGGGRLTSALGARGDAVYQVERGSRRLTFRGLFAQRGGQRAAA
ncbi:MAG: DUF58 domain-containing protein [Myxococcota bacterium]